jgi:hypothetical protein
MRSNSASVIGGGTWLLRMFQRVWGTALKLTHP